MKKRVLKLFIKIKKYREIVALILVIIFIILASTYDYSIRYYVNKIYVPYIIKDLYNSNLIDILFQVQASIATLGIAIIALLSEAAKQYVFGISISNYIMNDKRSIFKYKIIITTELVFVVLNYIIIAIKAYNLALIIFLDSIGLIIFMSCDIFVVFYGSKQIKKEIEEYYLSYFKKLYNKKYVMKCETVLHNLGTDIDEGIVKNDSIKIHENFDFLYEIFEEILER